MDTAHALDKALQVFFSYGFDLIGVTQGQFASYDMRWY